MGKKTPDPVIVKGDDKTPQITDSVARHVLYHFGDHVGQDGGHFATYLLMTLSHADHANLAKLQSVYPDYTFAFLTVRDRPWGLDWLRTKVMDAATQAVSA